MMNWKSIFTPGTITGVLAFIAALSVIIGKPALGAFLSDPKTAETLTMVVSGVVALIAGGLGGISDKKPE